MKKVFLLIILLMLSGCGKEEIYEDNTENFVKKTIQEVEVYNDINLNDTYEIVNNDIEVTSENIKIDTTKLGKQNLEINYKYDDKNYVYRYEIYVVDLTPPLVFSGTNKTIDLNYKNDLCDLITYGDNYTKEVKCTINGTYDLTQEGTYYLVYDLEDESANLTETNVTINVKKSVKNNTSSNKTTTNFSDIYNLHKNENTEIGIDVSKWQGNIDFSKVKEAGATFVMMRIGVQGSKNREISIDEYYEENIKKAKEAGLKVGVYFYSIATSKEEAISQAKWVRDTLNGEKLDLPVAFDWESWSSWNSFNLSFYDINSIADAFINELNEAGYDAMLYSSKFYLETIWQNKNHYPVWLAHYTKATTYEGDYLLWQLCNNGRIPGINGDVDIDILYKN